MHVYIPEGMAFPFLKPAFRPAAHWFIGSLYMQKTVKRYRKDAFVNMRSKILQGMMGDSYKGIIEACKRYGYVECDGDRVIGRKSYGYRLMMPWRHATHRRVELPGKVINKRNEKWVQSHRATWSAVHSSLWSMLNELELYASPNRHPKQSLAIARFHDGDFFMTVDRYGRVHTNVTNLKRCLRKRLRLRGQRLVEIDIVNSQPLMLSLLISNLIDNGGKLESINSYFQQSSGPSNPSTQHPPLCSGFARTRDIDHYQSLCESGQLYEFLMSHAGIGERQRGRFKRRVLSRCLYCKSKDQDNELFLLFERHFPTVAGIIRKIKRENGYKSLPHLMQRVESDMVIHRVCTRLIDEFPHVPIVTIHDCLLTTPEHVETVREIIMQEFSFVGMTPALKIKGT